jgi:hypothetical protein
MSGNGSAFSEYVSGNALPKITPTATNAGMIQNSMQSKSVGGYRRSKKSRRNGGSAKRKGRKSRSYRR